MHDVGPCHSYQNQTGLPRLCCQFIRGGVYSYALFLTPAVPFLGKGAVSYSKGCSQKEKYGRKTKKREGAESTRKFQGHTSNFVQFRAWDYLVP
jgi:hypothetical protein